MAADLIFFKVLCQSFSNLRVVFMLLHLEFKKKTVEMFIKLSEFTMTTVKEIWKVAMEKQS